jgi:uncharacterized protein YciI
MHYCLFYDYVPDVLTRRTPFREEHLGLLKELHAAGKLLAAGAFDPPSDGALIIFKGDSPADAEGFVKRDPYVKNGVVKGYKIRPWNVPVGG